MPTMSISFKYCYVQNKLLEYDMVLFTKCQTPFCNISLFALSRQVFFKTLKINSLNIKVFLQI